MILELYHLGCLAHASYLIADEAGGEAAVVDPQRDVELYVETHGGTGAGSRTCSSSAPAASG